jgi:hypothetical protein
MIAFKEHFQAVDVDRTSTSTTGTAGYNGAANHMEDIIIATVSHQKVALAMAALTVKPPSTQNGIARKHRRSTPSPDCLLLDPQMT